MSNLISNLSLGKGYIELSLPCPDSIEKLIENYFSTLLVLPEKIYNAQKSAYESNCQSFEKVEIDKEEATPADDIHEDELLNEKDEYHLRELRVFLRASLHELSKDKRYSIFWQPVDPVIIRDYYDVVKAPMDLETIRMKVDDGFYETKAAFIHDFQQISFNAKEYNPVSGKDQRGRNIIHLANSLVDVVESHAYNFKKELRFDVFKKCDEIAQRRGYKEPIYKNRRSMHPENKKYYSEILNIHKNLKKGTDPGQSQDDDISHWKCKNCRQSNSEKSHFCSSCNQRKPFTSPLDLSLEIPRKKMRSNPITISDSETTFLVEDSKIDPDPILPVNSSVIDIEKQTYEARSLENKSLQSDKQITTCCESFDSLVTSIILKSSIISSKVVNCYLYNFKVLYFFLN
jgi:hypothetical protein